MKNSILTLLILLPYFLFSQTNYYVDDDSNVDDVYTLSAVGNNSNDGLTSLTPKATFTNIWNTYGPSGINVLSIGDTIFIDAGTYYRTDRNLAITVGGAIVGADIDKTIFDNGNAGSTGYYFAKIYSNVSLSSFTIARYGIDNTYAHAINIQANQTNITINNIKIICLSDNFPN